MDRGTSGRIRATAEEVAAAKWVRSSLWPEGGVEVAELPGGDILVRRAGGQGVLRFTPSEWDAFTGAADGPRKGGVKAGEFDRP